jgi:hypothetical protein
VPSRLRGEKFLPAAKELQGSSKLFQKNTKLQRSNTKHTKDLNQGKLGSGISAPWTGLKTYTEIRRLCGGFQNYAMDCIRGGILWGSNAK